MTKKKENIAPDVPPGEPVDVASVNATADNDPPQQEQAPLDPKEIARRRSRADLENKRHNLRRGKR